MAAKKLRQIVFARLEDHRQIAAIHHMPAKPARGFDQIVEIAVQLRRSAGDIESRNVGARKKSQHRIDILPAHHLLARRSRFDMAVNARQVAVAPEIHLQHVDSPALEAIAV